MVPGGKTPVPSPRKPQEAGYKLALYPVMLLSSAIAAMQASLAAVCPGQLAATRDGDIRGVAEDRGGFPIHWQRETKYQVNA